MGFCPVVAVAVAASGVVMDGLMLGVVVAVDAQVRALCWGWCL